MYLNIKYMKTLHKLSVIFLKYAPFVAGVLMWIHVILKICRIDLLIAENLVGLPIIPCLVCYLWSKAFGFCIFHRLFMFYTTLVTYCININSDIFYFGNLLIPVRWLLFILGIFLIVIFIIKQIKYKYKFCHGEITNN